MSGLRAKHLPHKVTVQLLAGEGAEGPTFSAPDIGRPAYVEQKTRLVVDRRSSSPTFNQEITASTFVIMLTADDMAPGSLITVWAGTPRERTAAVIDSALYEYPRAPSHLEIVAE